MVFAAFFIGGAQKKTPTPYRWSGLRRSGAQWRSRQKVEIHGGGLVTAFDFLNDDGANDKGDGKAPRQKI